MWWYSTYCFEVTVHQILIELLCFFYDLSDLTLFLDNSSYSFHPILFKLGGQLDHEMVQCILFQGYSAPNFYRVITL